MRPYCDKTLTAHIYYLSPNFIVNRVRVESKPFVYEQALGILIVL